MRFVYFALLIETIHHQASAGTTFLRSETRELQRDPMSKCDQPDRRHNFDIADCDGLCEAVVSQCKEKRSGKYHCVCSDGYEGEAGRGHCPGSCSDINECLLSGQVLASLGLPAACTGTDFLCKNEIGSFDCMNPCDAIFTNYTMIGLYGGECNSGKFTTQCEVMNRMSNQDYKDLFGNDPCSGDKFLCSDLVGGGYKCVNPCEEIKNHATMKDIYNCSTTTSTCDIMNMMGTDFENLFNLKPCPGQNPCSDSNEDGTYRCVQPVIVDPVPLGGLDLGGGSTGGGLDLDGGLSGGGLGSDSGGTIVVCPMSMCGQGLYRDLSDCACKACTSTCTSPKEFPEFGGCDACVCPWDLCGTGKEPDEDNNCQCKDCAADLCTGNFEFQPGGGCKCVCPLDPFGCTGGQVLNLASCTCEDGP